MAVAVKAIAGIVKCANFLHGIYSWVYSTSCSSHNYIFQFEMLLNREKEFRGRSRRKYCACAIYDKNNWPQISLMCSFSSLYLSQYDVVDRTAVNLHLPMNWKVFRFLKCTRNQNRSFSYFQIVCSRVWVRERKIGRDSRFCHSFGFIGWKVYINYFLMTYIIIRVFYVRTRMRTLSFHIVSLCHSHWWVISSLLHQATTRIIKIEKKNILFFQCSFVSNSNNYVEFMTICRRSSPSRT